MIYFPKITSGLVEGDEHSFHAFGIFKAKLLCPDPFYIAINLQTGVSLQQRTKILSTASLPFSVQLGRVD